MKYTTRSLLSLVVSMSVWLAADVATAKAQTWDAALDLVANEKPDQPDPSSTELLNPNGQRPEWVYGYRATLGGTSLTPFAASANQHSNAALREKVDELEGWQLVGGFWPFIVANVTGQPLTLPGLQTLQPDELSLHPGNGFSSDTFAVVRWIAPAAGNYDISAAWRDLDPNGGDGFGAHIVLNGASIFDANPANGGSTSVARTISISAGDFLEFVLDPGPNGDQNFDSTALKVTVKGLTDTDGDSLPDAWERQGVTIDDAGNATPGDTGNGVFIALPAMGANPLHKDIFVHADWMGPDPEKPSSQLKPSPEAMQILMDSFAAAPVSNPDGLSGINLHVDLGDDSVMNPITGKHWGTLSRAAEHAFESLTDPSQFEPLELYYFSPARRRSVFHYAYFCNGYLNLNNFSSGVSSATPGTDFLVALGKMDEFRADPPGGTVIEQAGTFMHELGHNLGLRHGGYENVQYKPNYLSVMNYRFQFPGVLLQNAFASAARRIDYSRELLDPLDKKHLVEAVGINDPAGHFTLWSCTSPDDTSSEYYKQFVPALDWNLKDGINAEPVEADINCDGSTNVNTILYGFNDWPALVYDGGSVIGPAGGTRRASASEVSDEPSIETLIGGVPTELLDEESTSPHDVATFSPAAGTVPLTVGFDGSGSTSVEGNIVDWVWDFGDGTTATGATAAHTYDVPGVFFAQLSVIDDKGHSNLIPFLHRITAASPFELVSAASRKSHGTAGNFEIQLPLSGGPGVECRDGAGNLALFFTFTNTVVTGRASIVNGTASIVDEPVFADNLMSLNLNDVADVQTIGVALTGVTDEFGQILPDTTIIVAVLIGDTTGDKKVTASDIRQARGQVGLPVTSSNFREDVNISGSIDRSDVRLVRSRKGGILP